MRMSNSYWERRQAETMYEYMEKAEKVADEIAQLYLKASRYLSSQADDVFEKYQTKYGLTENEARRLLNELQDKTSLDELLEKLKNGGSDMSRQELLKQLEAPAYQARLERLRQLQNQLDLMMTQIYNQEKQKNTGFYTDLANESYYKSMFNIQQQTGLAFSFSAIDPQMIDQVVNSKWSGKNYSERIWKNTEALAHDIKEQLLLGLVTGKTNREVSKEIQNKYAVGAATARRLVRTESCYIANEMNFNVYEESGIEKYRYCAILDLRTSQICRSLDRKIFLVKERKIGVNSPPMHPWCRSTTTAVISENLLKNMTRRARDPITGKVLTVPANMSYHSWYDKYVKGKPEAELAEKQIKNRTTDRKQWERYKKTLGKDYVPDNLDDFQKLKYTDGQEYGILKAQVKGMTYYNRAIANEANITEMVKKVAQKAGMNVEGLEHRIKTKDSYLRKIRANYNPVGNRYEVKDIVRYTYTDLPEVMTEKALRSIEIFRECGYNTIEIKNYWLNKSNPYNGVNTTMKTTNGQKFELQYHTQESYTIKEGKMHKLYEKQRVLTDISSKEYIELEDKMFELSDSMQIPERIERIRNVK